MARKRRRMNAVVEVSLTPLIDTALTLLVIFMITTPMMHNAIRITLPKGDAQEDTSKQQDIMVQIDDKKGLHINGVALKNSDELVPHLKKMIGEQRDKIVHVYGATGVDYGFVIELVDNLKTVGGIRHVALATQRRSA